MKLDTRGRRTLLALGASVLVAILVVGGCAGYFLSLYPAVEPTRWPGTWPCAGEGVEKELQTVLDEYADELDGIAVQATVIGPDGAEWTGVAGYADIKDTIAVTPDDRLLVGSVTKMFTSAITLREIERGRLTLDDPIGLWIEGLTYGDQVTVRMLLAQRSGIPNYSDGTWFKIRYFGQADKDWEPDELVAMFADATLDFEPDSRFAYSNSNYVLLGLILEEATGSTYERLVADLAAELGLDRTCFLCSDPSLDVTRCYDETRLNLGRRDITAGFHSFASGAFSSAGIVSDSRDIAKFVRELLTGHVVSDDSLEAMLAFTETVPYGMEPQTGYGMGLRRWEIGGWTWIGHTGSVPGFSSVAMHAPEQDYTVVVLTNLSSIDQAEILARIQNVLTTEE